MTTRLCVCGCGSPLRPDAPRKQQFASMSCASRSRYRDRGRQSKVCGCGCGERFERPDRIGAKEWAKRKFAGEAHYRRWQQDQVGLAERVVVEDAGKDSGDDVGKPGKADKAPPSLPSLPPPAWRRPPEPVEPPVRRRPRVDLRKVRVPRPPQPPDESPQD